MFEKIVRGMYGLRHLLVFGVPAPPFDPRMLDRPDPVDAQAEMLKRACAWIVGGDTGLSSKALWANMMGVVQHQKYSDWPDWSHPSDMADFGRCERLLVRLPEWRERLPEMAVRSPYWAELVKPGVWDRLVQDGSYEMIKDVYAPVYEARTRAAERDRRS